jgi:acetyl-CoA C-acetyltransferase
MSKGKLAIVGIGEVPTGIYPDRSEWQMIYAVVMEAIKDSGLDRNDIEGVITVNPMAQHRLASEIAFGKVPEELGLKGCKDVCIANAGGAGVTNCLRLAEQWIDAGIARNILILSCTKHTTIPIQDQINFFATAGMDLQWEYPFGMTYNGYVGLLTERYMSETGTTAEEMASVIVAHRKWAALDPYSMFYGKEPLTIEKVLSSRMVSTPLRARECNVLADGAAAMVVTSADSAREITNTPVYKVGDGLAFNGASMSLRSDFLLREGFREAGNQALAEAGITREDIDIFEFYGAYPVWFCVLFEALGITQPGETGKFIMEGHTSPGGKCPSATIGDAIGRGHTGSGVSMAYYVETARQLMGKAGERQVQDCNYVLFNTSGGSGMNSIVTIFGRELS